MKKFHAILASAVLALSTFASVTPASASEPYDPNVARVANPANACKSIPGSVQYAAAILGFPVDTSSFDYSACVTTLAQGAAVVEPVEEYGDPYAQCDGLVAAGFVSYPSTLHNGDGLEDSILPDLIVKNRKECGSALYAFHSIVTYLFGPE